MTDNGIKYLWYLKCQFHQLDFYEPYKSIWGWTWIQGESYAWRITSKGHDFINHHFYKCTQVYKIEMTKEWFISYLKEEPNRWGNPWRRKRKYDRWNWKARLEARYRTTKYIRKAHHKKKELSETEIAKREWREKKQFRKDKSKAYWKRGAGKYYKRMSNQMHRAYERENLSTENWDYLCNNDYKYYLDPWLWD